MRHHPILAVLVIVLAAPPQARADESDFSDVLGTLALDHTLDARGQLGGMAVDALGFVYVANFRDALWRISPEGEVEILSRAQYGSSGIAVGPEGDIFQSNFNGNTIDRVRRNGDVERFASGLSGPVGIAIDAEGRLFVCNCSANNLSKVSPEGAVEPFAESSIFACPNGIVLADDGNFYVTNFNSNDIARVTPEGEVEKFTTVPGGAGNAHITQAKGVFYVTKILTHRVMRIAADGSVSPLAGSGTAGHEDGPALEGSLNHPNAIAASPLGDRLYVNTVVGDYRESKPSAISVRTLDLVTLGGLLEDALEDGLEALDTVYHRYKADPIRGAENTSAEMTTWGYKLLSTGRARAALTVFQLNADSYQNDPGAQYHLGEALRYAGLTDRAVSQYRRTLDLDPLNQQAQSRLEQLDAGE